MSQQAEVVVVSAVRTAIGTFGGSLNDAPPVELAAADEKLIDMMNAALHDPFYNIHMGMTAENIAARWNISRADHVHRGRTGNRRRF